MIRVVETTPPVITITSPAQGAYLGSNAVQVEFTVTDTESGVDPDSISVKIDSGAEIKEGITKTPIQDGYKCSYTATVQNGSHTVKVNASDNDENAAVEKTASFSVDTIAPTLNITSPPETLITNQQSLTVSGKTSPDCGVTIKLNSVDQGEITVDGTGQFDKPITLSPGENVIEITATSLAGKTTTALSVMRLLPQRVGKITHGSITLDGVDILSASEHDMRLLRGNVVSMIFQDPMTSLNPTMTIGKQIMEPMIYHYKRTKKEAYEKALELLELVGITDAEKRMKNYPHQLSGGMRQRIVIAIALSCDPYVLICDEPTTALDVTIQAKILELIQDIQKKKELSVIYITHDLGVVAKVADYVNVMYAGKIVETGTIDEIFYDPRHPYTWGLLSSMPDLDTSDDELYTIPGTPPNLAHDIQGDAFAPRNEFALNIDLREDPPMFDVPGSKSHQVASWLMHPNAPKVEMPETLRKRLELMKKKGGMADE